MWYVKESCSAELGELGRSEGETGAERLKQIAENLMKNKKLTYQERWNEMSAEICVKPM